jgi:hypothetical protein
MDCRGFKDLLDSYLSQELAIETNHEILRHAGHCGGCRAEMAARRRLRETLRRVCLQEKMTDEACDRLRAKLRVAAGSEAQKKFSPEWREVFSWKYAFRFVLPAAATVALLIFGGAYYLLRQGESPKGAPELSAALFDESAGDHRKCAVHFVNSRGPAAMAESVKLYDPAYASLEKVAEIGAQGLQLRAAHLCGYEGRKFAHLVYTRESQLISLLVTERDGRALKIGEAPFDDGSQSGMQHALRDHLSMGAYQTAKHVVLVVSDLPERENSTLAERLAVPVAEHLRQVERISMNIGFQFSVFGF